MTKAPRKWELTIRHKLMGVFLVALTGLFTCGVAVYAIPGAMEENAGRFALTVLGAVALILAFAGAFIIRDVIYRLRQIRTQVNRIAAGDLDLTLTLEVSSSDELDEIACAFNRFIARQRAAVQGLAVSARRLNDTAQTLSGMSERTSGSTSRITDAVHRISEGAQEQVQRVQAGADAMHSLSRSADEVTRGTKDVADSSQVAAETARAARQSAQDAIQRMREIETAVTASAEKVLTLGDRSKEIRNVVEVLTKIAHQTNLLALNAAIEAARAGEAGRGFAVVAEEVRKLADGSRNAADQISDLVARSEADTKDVIATMTAGADDVSEGAEVVKSALQSMDQTARTIEKTSETVHAITRATLDQTAHVKEVSATVENIAAIARETSTAAEATSGSATGLSSDVQELAALAQGLANLANELQEIMSRFKTESAAAGSEGGPWGATADAVPSGPGGATAHVGG